MADFPVPFNDRLISYTAAGGETTFDFDFPVFINTGISVYRTRVTTTELTLTTDYTVSINTDQEADPGGTITPVAAVEAGDVWVIVGSTVVERTSDFQQRGGWQAAEINEQFDAIIMMIQEMKRVGLVFDEDYTGTTGTIDKDGITNGYFLRRTATGYDHAQVVSAGSISTPVAVAEGGTGGTTAAAARSNLAVPGLAVANTFTTSQAITGNLGVTGTITSTSTDAGAGGGPYLTAFRDSATPAASDIVGGMLMSGRDSGGNVTSYAFFDATILDPTDGSEDARVRFVAMVAGTLTVISSFGPGFQIGAPTGGDKGAGTLNVDTGIYIDGQPVGQTVTFSADKGGAGAVTLTSGTPVKITFGTENWDIGAAFASSTWTPPAGKYDIKAGVEIANTNAVDNEILVLHLYKNGSAHRELLFKRGSTTGQSINGSWLVDANGTDTFEIYVTKSGAGDGGTTTAAARNYFQGTAL
jgi:hypothetical protein